MRYFLIRQESNCLDLPIIDNWYGIIDVRNITREKCHMLPRRQLLLVKSNPHMIFSDIVSTPFFIVTEKIIRVIKSYVPYVVSKEIILLDSVNGQAELYYLPVLDIVNCLSPKSKLSLDSSTILQPVFEATNTIDYPIFKIGDVKNSYIAVNLEVAESILKAGAVGIEFTPILVDR